MFTTTAGAPKYGALVVVVLGYVDALINAIITNLYIYIIIINRKLVQFDIPQLVKFTRGEITVPLMNMCFD